MPQDKFIETDVLVIGGGLAGCFAAVKAREQGCNVILADKGFVSRSGETPYARVTMVFNPQWGHRLDAWLDQISAIGEYVNNRHWNELVFKDSYDRYLDMESWGVKFLQKDGEPQRIPHPLKNIGMPDENKFPPLVSEVLHWMPGFFDIIRKQVIKSGVKIIDRLMITDLIKQDGQIKGAIGMTIEDNDIYIFEAKATVVAAGGDGFRPVNYPTHELTGDGHAMAYKAGATILGKEFIASSPLGPDYQGWPPLYPLFTSIIPAAAAGGRPPFKIYDAAGNAVPPRGMAWHGWIDYEAEEHAGKAPLYYQDYEGKKHPMLGPGHHGALLGLATSGVYPTDDFCSSQVPGLFAAGDSLGTCFVGGVYAGFGFGTMYAIATGARAGLGAARYVSQVSDSPLNSELLSQLKKQLLAPIDRQGGFSPRWVTKILQNTLLPYFVLFIKKEDRLKAALTNVEFLRDHMVPMLYARDDHELRLAHETSNMVLNAEMKLRASIFRQESRGNHFREDYPRRNDSEWLVWVTLKQANQEMKLFKEPIPEEWHPDKSKTYEEKYPVRFPGE
jgi:succinate dehydrogenase/fumarate reductase flavoprotein subunit